MKKHWYVSLLATVLILLSPVIAAADVNDFTVTDFSANYYLNRSDPQGTLVVKERLAVDFTGQNHGILRALPQKYNGQDEHVHIDGVQRDGNPEPYTTYTSNGNEVLKIGNPDQTISGRHVYDIDYDVQNVIRFTAEGNELDWNTNGTQWMQPFQAETAELHVAANLQTAASHPQCFTGTQGSTQTDCGIAKTADGYSFTTGRALSPGETMTFVLRFASATFAKPTPADWLHDHATALAELLLPPLLALAIVYPYWRRNGKDIHGRGTIVPEYGPPDGLLPAEADVIIQYKLGGKAVSATIIDLAIRKYLKIIETTTSGVLGLGKHKSYSFERLPAPARDQLKGYEQQVLAALFPSGDTTDIGSLKSSFYLTARTLQKDLPAQLTLDGYFPRNPRRVGNVMHVIGVVLVIGGLAIGGPTVYSRVGLALSGLVVLLFGFLMPKRSQRGVDAKDALAGLKLYMEVAEKDRLQMLQSVDAPYTERSTEPTKTVALFEKLLPYAIILGVETSWARQFESIYTTPPDWYVGNWQSFNAGYFVGSLNESISTMNSSFAAPASSGSGTGGGFAGGGGGGGGGGGW